MRVSLPPRLVDGTVIVAVVAALATGGLTLLAGRTGDAWVFAAHGDAGFVLAAAIVLKLRRVWPRLRRADRWDAGVVGSVAALLVVLAALATGVAWVHGVDAGIGPWTGLVVHAFLGLLLVPPLAIHLRRRFRLPRRRDVADRRSVLLAAAFVVGGALVWRLQQALMSALADGSGRRFTGSRDAGGRGNAFPVTSWVADDPDPVDPAAWTLRVEGAVGSTTALGLADLDRPDGGADGRQATLDCTSGWYADRDWTGVRLGRLLDAAGVRDEARWATVESVTGYRVCLPIAEAREALLATRVDGERLSHGHGAPARLVAPGRRGFQWVKWVVRIEARRTPDYGAWVSIFTSGFTRGR